MGRKAKLRQIDAPTMRTLAHDADPIDAEAIM
jgi:hypothetical protein